MKRIKEAVDDIAELIFNLIGVVLALLISATCMIFTGLFIAGLVLLPFVGLFFLIKFIG